MHLVGASTRLPVPNGGPERSNGTDGAPYQVFKHTTRRLALDCGTPIFPCLGRPEHSVAQFGAIDGSKAHIGLQGAAT
eukprot:4107545-Pleurochrysis_carterae.AAC.1